ncbi:MAG: hypothetical protein IJW61_04415 [Clostridia bacterium]|nr:hypothetical protein [Clostridia bacterium]
MFGYVKPDSAELRVREYDFYRATYCGICRAMQAHTGVISSATLSYDSVFLALVRMLYTKDEKFEAEMRRCIAHPLKKRPMLKENDALIYTAKAFAVLTYYKMRDDLSDEGGAKRVLVSAARPVVSHAVSLADMPELERIAEEKLSAITALERENCESADRPAALFGELLGEIFAWGLSGSDRTVTYQCGYALGKFIYCADAAEDYYKDRSSGSYNPYLLMYGGRDLTAENRATIKCALTLECQNIERAVDLMPFEHRETIEEIIKNIIYLGLIKRISFLDRDYSEERRDKN